ncbi:hypothetical protein Cni_G14781 [Canna indica]|uniref:Reverse transcriptase n=1 Tax=Canna indica TaxID=4628 RepID=A0AAQ3KDG0_9LILI|nr:hypothetical protein Cni_G14781 [Canna indica]
MDVFGIHLHYEGLMRERQVDLLINKVNTSYLRSLLGGDFNSILREEEKIGGESYAAHMSSHLEKLIRSTNLMEFSTTGLTFTWCNRRQHDQLIEKVLDRFLGSMDWCDIWRNSIVLHLDDIGSDHRPILLQPSSPHRAKRSFKFDKRWLENDLLSEVISRAWNSSVPDTLQHQVFSKLKLVKQGIINWLKLNPQNSYTCIKRLQHQLHALTPANSLDYSIQKKTLEAELHQALKDEEIYWRQKSRIKWLQEGDRNTRYFHACTKARRTFNNIPRIKNSANEWVEGVEQVAQVALSHFKNKFCSSNPTDISRHLQAKRMLIMPHVSTLSLVLSVGSNTILHALGTPCIPIEPAFSVYGPAPHPSSTVLVSHLFDKEIRMWKAQEVRKYFHHSVAEKILHMNIPSGLILMVFLFSYVIILSGSQRVIFLAL